MSLVDNLIYMITPATASVPANSVLPLTTIARRTGRILKSSSDSIILGAPGYYKVTATITYTAPEAGVASFKMQKASIDIPGITASESVITPETEYHTVTLSGVIRIMPFDCASVLTILNSGIAITTSNISFDVEYLG